MKIWCKICTPAIQFLKIRLLQIFAKLPCHVQNFGKTISVEFGWGHSNLIWIMMAKLFENGHATLSKQAVPINGDNIPPLWSVPTPSRNTQQIVLFLSHCGSYTGENHSRKICLRRISAWLCPLECHGMEGIEAAFDTKSLGNVKKVFAKSCGNPIFGQFLATRGPKMRARTRKSIGVQRLTP